MQQLGWSIRYFLHLFRQSYLLVLLLGVQVFATVGTSQGREMLMTYAVEGTGFQLIAYGSGLFLSGFLYCFGAYWLFFFSNLRGRQYEPSEEYANPRYKVRAGIYQDFMALNRERLARLYTRFLLFGPWFSVALFAWSAGIAEFRFLLVVASVAAVNLTLMYGTVHPQVWFVRLSKSVFRNAGKGLEGAYFTVQKALTSLFRLTAHPGMPQEDESDALLSEVKWHSISNTRPQHRGFFYLSMVGAFLLEAFLFQAPSTWIAQFGALALLQLGLCVWVVFFVWLGYLDKVYAFPFKVFLLGWIIWVSSQNQDHPVRLYPVQENVPQPVGRPRQTAASHFNHWLSTRPGFKAYSKSDSFQIGGITYSTSKPYPLLIICAEGGANRSAYWTANLMAALRQKIGPTFDEHLFAISSVSGGSIGALTYSAARHRMRAEQAEKTLDLFFDFDLLSGLTNRLVVGEPFHWISTQYYPNCDRAVAFEENLDRALAASVFQSGTQLPRPPTFAEALQPPIEKALYQPIHLINCTEAESGRCFVLSEADLSHDPAFRNQLIAAKLTKPIRLSAAMHLSARFPVFSPAAAITDASGVTRHYVDGGYYDNVGYETAHNLLTSIRKSKFANAIRPVIYSIVNGYEEEESLVDTRQMDRSRPNRSRNFWDGVHFLNEPMEVVTTVSKVRSANGRKHLADLLMDVKSGYKGLKIRPLVQFDLKSNNDLVPMNWYLSKSSKQIMDQKVERAITQIGTKKIDLGLEPIKRNEVHPPPSRVEPSQSIQISKSLVLPISPRSTKNKELPKSAKVQKRKRNQPPPGMYWSVSQKKWVSKAEAKYPLRPSKRRLWRKNTAS